MNSIIKYSFKLLIFIVLLSDFVHSEAEIEQLPQIVAFLGSKRVGKDTSADFLVRMKGYKKYSLADPMKKALKLLFHFSDDQLWGDDKEAIDPYWQVSPREMMQFIGIDVLAEELPNRFPPIKSNGKNFHIRHFDLYVKQHPTELLVISDLRMQEDVFALKEMGAVIIKLIRPGTNNNDTHISEQGVAGIVSYDYEVINGGTIDQLEQKIEEILLQESLKRNLTGYTDFPTGLSICIDEVIASQLFKVAVANARQYDSKWVEDKLNLILAGEFQSLSPEEIKRLKKERILLSMLRNACKMLCKTHEPPHELARYEECLGDLNDALANNLSEHILSFARKFQAKLSLNVIDMAVEQFEPTSRESFDKLVYHLLEHLSTSVQQATLPIAEFHEIRWTLKYFLNLFRIYEQVESNSLNKLALEILERNNQVMGVIHDQAVAADMKGKIKYQDSIVEVPLSVQKTVFELSSALKKVK